MKRISIRLFIVTSLLAGLFCQSVSAADYASMTTEQLSALRGTMYDSPAQEREAFRNEWLKRIEQMTEAQKQHYLGSGTGRGMGSRGGAGIGDGSGRGRGGSGSGNSGGNGSGGGNNGGSGGGGQGRQ